MKWALVLSGGGSRGLVYVGMLKAFQELKLPKPNCIVGCSIGSIIGGLYASGMNVDEMYAFFSNHFQFDDYIDISKFRFGQTRISKLLQIGVGLNNLYTSQGIDSGEKSYELFKKMTHSKTFEQANIPFYCNAVNLCNGREVIFEKGILADGMRASYSYPVFFKPYHHNGCLFVDGCVKHNTPVWIAREKGYKNILAITLGTFQVKTENQIDSTLAVLQRALEVATSETVGIKNNAPTFILNMDATLPSYDFSKFQYLFDLGYSITMEHADELNAFFKKGLLGILNRKKMSRQILKRLKHERIF